jgi:HTH-type transcriptional regulator/antitoxin HigA
MKKLRILRTESDYDEAVAEIEKYFVKEPKRGTLAADRFDMLALLIEDYERNHDPIDGIEPSDALDAIRQYMEMSGRTHVDLGRLLGSQKRASEILSGKRALTLKAMRALHNEWGIPADFLIMEPAAA